MNMQAFQISFLLVDSVIKLASWRMVTEMMGRIGYGVSESLARGLGAIAVVGRFSSRCRRSRSSGRSCRPAISAARRRRSCESVGLVVGRVLAVQSQPAGANNAAPLCLENIDREGASYV